MRKLVAAAVPLLLCALPAWGAEGVHGRAAWRGVVAPGISIHAFAGTAGADPSTMPVASTRTAQDGTYRLSLPPGAYNLVARSGAAGSRPAPGEFFCFYSGSPVEVRRGQWAAVGFNLVRVPYEERARGERSLLEGTVTWQDQPLEKLYLHVYRDAGGGFRGPGAASYPVGAGGRFRVGVPPGRYYLVARKRAQGGMYGPVEIGDHFNFYPGNPVTVGEKETVRLALETVTRLSQLEEEGEKRVPRLTGRVVDGGGAPVAGLRVLAYPPGESGLAEEGKGRPLAFSAPSGAAGTFTLDLPRAGSYRLVARARLGGPAAPGDWRGEAAGGKPVEAGDEGVFPPVVITVERAP